MRRTFTDYRKDILYLSRVGFNSGRKRRHYDNIVEEKDLLDGDQVTVKSVFSVEANQELKDQIDSKRHFISLGEKNIMETTNEGVMALYSLTMDLGNAEFTNPEF